MSQVLQFRQDRVAERLTEKRIVMLPQRMGKLWTRSRLVVIGEGVNAQPVPILWLLAREAFPDWNPKTHDPYWKDRDWTNESVENVELAEVGMGEKKTSALGLPSGTKEYWRAYRLKNREKYRSYQRNYGRRRREEFKELREKFEATEKTLAEKSQAKLEDIFAEVQRAQPQGDGKPSPTGLISDEK